MSIFRKKREPVKLKVKDELTKAKAELARLEQLPSEDFTTRGTSSPFSIQHSIDMKPRKVARAKARIAELEVLEKEGVLEIEAEL